MHKKVILLTFICRVAPNISDPVKKQEFKQNQKRHAEISQDFVKDLFAKVIEIRENYVEVEQECEFALVNVVREAVEDDIDLII